MTVSALDALNHAARTAEAGEGARGLDNLLVAAWMDGQRGEVFAALYDGASAVDEPSSSTPKRCCDAGARFRPDKPWSSSGMDR